MIWNQPRRPQQNGVVERAQGTTNRWSEPEQCLGVSMLRDRMGEAVRMQRSRYPFRDGLTREQAYPQLLSNSRQYRRETEAEQFSLQRIAEYLARGTSTRRIDSSGKISLWGRNHYISKSRAGDDVSVNFDPARWEWVIRDTSGDELRRDSTQELTQENVIGLNVLHR